MIDTEPQPEQQQQQDTNTESNDNDVEIVTKVKRRQRRHQITAKTQIIATVERYSGSSGAIRRIRRSRLEIITDSKHIFFI